MKRIFTMICVAVMLLSTANAKLIFQESFDGKNGTVGQLSAGDTRVDGADNADFFNGSTYNETRWWSFSGNSNYIQVVEGSMSFAGYQTGIGNRAYLWSTGADDVRSFSSKAVTSGKVYLAAIINIDALKQKADADYFMCLGDHANSRFLGRLYTRSVQTDGEWTGFQFGIAKNNESTTYINYTDEVYEPGKNYLVVIEYEFVSGEKNDNVCLYVNPTKDTTTPTLVCQQSILGGYNNSEQGASGKDDAGMVGIFGAFLRQGLNTPKVYVDEIKVATAWSDLFVEGAGEEEQKTEVDNIAALLAAPVMKGVLLKSQPIVINIEGTGKDFCVTIQDESGAVIINDFSEMRLLNNVQVGDKLDKLAAMPIESSKYINGLATAQLSAKSTPEILVDENGAQPFAVTLDNVAQYGPALVQLSQVSFVIGAEKKFTEGRHTITQNDAEADLVVPVGCDIIGEDIPAKANVKALVVKNLEGDVRIRILASADVTNRVAAGDETGIQNTEHRTQTKKVFINGQLVILKNGKKYNVLGSEL